MDYVGLVRVLHLSPGPASAPSPHPPPWPLDDKNARYRVQGDALPTGGERRRDVRLGPVPHVGCPRYAGPSEA
jgi:hypothetical protein